MTPRAHQRNWHAPRSDAQGGQALIFTLLFAAVTAIVCLMLYNSGKLANTKTQLQNAADAGAYSGAVLLARDHNFSAYTNRAMVANQVSVAQLVSLKSYLDDAAATHKRMTTIHSGWAKVIPAYKPAWDLAKAMPIETVAKFYDAAAPLAVKGLDTLIRAMQTAQEAHHTATAFNVAVVANQVVQRNDPDAEVSLLNFQTAAYTAQQVKDWAMYTSKQQATGTGKSSDRFAGVVVDRQSTDELSRKRSSVLHAGWLSTPTSIACPPPLIPIPFVGTVYGFKHAGGTVLSADKKRWLALDATQGEGLVACETEVGIPVGYPLLEDGAGGSGGGLAGSSGGYNTRRGFSGNPSETANYGGALSGLTALAARSRYDRGPGTSMDVSGGLQNYYRDVADAATPANQSAELNGGARPFTIEVRHAGAAIRTSSKVIGTGAGTIRADEQLKGDTMRAMASGEAYFFRPQRDSSAFNRAGWQRADGRTELANLFNPYWQAQLTENPPAALLLSVAGP